MTGTSVQNEILFNLEQEQVKNLVYYEEDTGSCKNTNNLPLF